MRRIALPAVVRVGVVQKIVENLAAVDDSKVSAAALHGARIVPRRMTRRLCERGRRSEARGAGSRPRSADGAQPQQFKSLFVSFSVR
jgi:hypothetical protein